jgi:acyl-coenzyme A thioesterase PaaI-like protein
LTGEALAARARQALAVPLQARIGARLLDDADPPAGVWFPVTDLADNGFGGLHAAALQAALELAGYLALIPQLTEQEHAVTHTVSTQLIAAAAAGERVEARGSLDRRTRRIAFVTVVATVDDRTIARSQLTKSIVPLG